MLSARTITALNGAATAVKHGCKARKLIQIMCNHTDLWMQAYANIYANKGALTRGVNRNTLDGFSEDRVINLIQLIKDGLYYPTPVRRTYIPKDASKPNGKLRPLGIPTGDDKLVQEVMRMILEALYEPVFSDRSHGFRPRRSCHTALDEIKSGWKGTKWICEVDIKGFFDNISHERLLHFLSTKIDDRAFLNLINRFLRAGYVEDWRWNATHSGTPQGGVISPILANIYLNELDFFMQGKMSGFYSGARRRTNPHYHRLVNQAGVLRKRLREDTEMDEVQRSEVESHLHQLEEQYVDMGSQLYDDPCFQRMRYVRYADDFIIGIIGTKAQANEIMAEVTAFIETELKLEVSTEKSRVRYFEQGIVFLGYGIRTRREDKRMKKVVGKRLDGTKVHAMVKTISGHIHFSVPEEKCRKFVQRLGIAVYDAGKAGFRSRKGIVYASEYEIVSQFNAELRGFANYYNRCARLYLNKVEWFWVNSLVRTLSTKWGDMQPSQVFSRLKQADGSLSLSYMDKQKRQCKLKVFNLSDRAQATPYQKVDLLPNTFMYGGRTELLDRMAARECEYCGRTGGYFEVHHVRKLKDIAAGKTRWEKMMIARRRKTLVLCRHCHTDLHNGVLPDARALRKSA